MSPFTAADVQVLNLALDCLGRQSDAELALARRQTNHAKQLVLIALRQRLANVRIKVQAMPVSP